MLTLLITLLIYSLTLGLLKGISYYLFSLGYAHNSNLLLNLSFSLNDLLAYSPYLCVLIGVLVLWFVYKKENLLSS
jgi:hypothetical protein